MKSKKKSEPEFVLRNLPIIKDKKKEKKDVGINVEAIFEGM